MYKYITPVPIPPAKTPPLVSPLSIHRQLSSSTLFLIKPLSPDPHPTEYRRHTNIENQTEHDIGLFRDNTTATWTICTISRMPPVKPRRVAEIMLSWLGLDLISCTELQILWAGYGHICAVEARDSNDKTKTTSRMILKLISPPGLGDRTKDEGHLRKMLSYQVEQYFYQEIAPRLLEDGVAVAECLASTRDSAGKPHAEELHGLTATLMSDLRPQFPVAGGKRSALRPRQVHAALDWLARFHSSSWASLPDNEGLDLFLLPPLEEAKRRRSGQVDPKRSKLWLNGGYTYLATRRKEYASLADDETSEWSAAFCKPLETNAGDDGPSPPSSVAELVAAFLTPSGRPFETYIHGDVKSENLFTTEPGDRVAFFDFQYVGLGLGVCDLAKLFTCSVPLDMLADCRGPDEVPLTLPMEEGEKALLEKYRQTLLSRKPSGRGPLAYDWCDFVRHWETALVDWCRFQASWGFWGNTEWLEARVRFILGDDGWRNWLREECTRLHT
ncbi:hypothetical protein ACRALDRAFT_2141744 [Sodiomyces alcalophilus JCM 7366]|uniref:uncharacterized protein n=1 Tax=Sodiomyces alcalophilus JCM 7366 TaxID=591952 RepID=UPI0039B45F29